VPGPRESLPLAAEGKTTVRRLRSYEHNPGAIR
jgi:hypothetical protein